MSRVLVVLAAVLTFLPACKPPPLREPLKPIEPVDAFRRSGGSCTAARPQPEPDLMGWDATSRANLTRLRRKGVVAVRYEASGCDVNLELLSNCIASGTYEFAPYSANEHKVAHDENELRAALPLGANSLAAKLKGGLALRTDYMLAGTYSIAPGSYVTETDLKGPDCARATHVVSAVFVGGFALAAGQSRSLDADASLFGVGVGAASHAALENVYDEGNAAACKQAQSEGKESERCAVPLRVGLLAIKRSGDAPPAEGRTVALPTLTAVPPVPLETGGVALDADADVLVAYDAALEADKTGTRDAARAASAWKAVAAGRGPNPYVVLATERAQRWAEYAAKMKARQAQHAVDTERLRKILPLGSLSLEQKERVLRDYVRLYGRLAAVDLAKLVKPEKAGAAIADRLAIPMGTFPSTKSGLSWENGNVLEVYGLTGQPARAKAAECESGDDAACTHMARAYLAGLVSKATGSDLAWKDVEQDHGRAALEMYQRACDRGAKEACMSSLRWLSASGTADEKAGATKELEANLTRACDLGLTDAASARKAIFACLELEKLYRTPAMRDRTKEAEASEKGWRAHLLLCERGDDDDCTMVAYGASAPKALKERASRVKEERREKRCHDGDDSICLRIVESYGDDQDDEGARKFYAKGLEIARKGCAAGDLGECNMEGMLHAAAKQPRKALAIFTGICNAPSKSDEEKSVRADACELAAVALVNGGPGLPVNKAAAVPFLKRACVLAGESPCERRPE